MTSRVHVADAAELADWDRRAVDVPGGHVLQSMAWAGHRERTGWSAHHLVFQDDRVVLALVRRWPIVGGGRAYLPRGPVTAGDPVDAVVDRLSGATSWLAERGLDVVVADPEIAATNDYASRVRDLGYRPTEEVEPARHRLSLRIDGADEEALLGRVAKTTRQRIRGAEAQGVVVRRFDVRAQEGAGAGFLIGPAGELPGALTAFHRLVLATGERRGFRLGPLQPFLAWLLAAHAAGHAIYLEARAPGTSAEGDDQTQPLAGLLIYRHGERLSTSISGDDAAARARHPGLLHLLRWRAIQIAARERRVEMDLGGVDVAGARREPQPGESMYGLYQHKRSFGAEFVEQVGAHRRILRPAHFALVGVGARLLGRHW